MSGAPELTVVVPVLDEVRAGPRLVRELARQRGLSLELVAVDGGSGDGSPELLERAAREAGLALRLLSTPAGRGRQLNAGARAATGVDLLFLHADSELADPELLRRARERMDRERSDRGTHRIAGHFGVAFRGGDGRDSFATYVLEARSRVSRPGFVTGDQGFWLARRYFDELGGFEESLPLFEDCRLADLVFETGAWTCLPGVLVTSPRRFEVEGYAARLLLNALLRGCDAAGLREPLEDGRSYRPQGRAGALDVPGFCSAVHRGLAGLPPRQALRALSRAGAYAASQAWQLPLLLSCLVGRLRGVPAGELPLSLLRRFDPGPSTSPSGRGLLRHASAGLLGAAALYGSWLGARLFLGGPCSASLVKGAPAAKGTRRAR